MKQQSCDASIDVKTMLILAIATSIDALAVGVTFAFLDVRILPGSQLYRLYHVHTFRDRR